MGFQFFPFSYLFYFIHPPFVPAFSFVSFLRHVLFSFVFAYAQSSHPTRAFLMVRAYLSSTPPLVDSLSLTLHLLCRFRSADHMSRHALLGSDQPESTLGVVLCSVEIGCSFRDVVWFNVVVCVSVCVCACVCTVAL